MGWLKNPFKRKSTEVVDSQALAEMIAGLGLSEAGINVTPANSMQIASFYACVRVLAETLGMLPLNLFEETDKSFTLISLDESWKAVYLPVTQHSALKTITQNTAAPWHGILITFNIFSLHSYR